MTYLSTRKLKILLPLKEAINLVGFALKNGKQGDIFVRNAPSCSVGDLAQALINILGSDSEIKTIGMRHGEKMHETLIPEDESRNVLDFGTHFVLQPVQSFWGNKIGILGGASCSQGFCYASNRNDRFLDREGLSTLLRDYLPAKPVS